MHIQTKIAIYYLYIHTNQILYQDNQKIAKTITINFLDFPYYHSNKYHKKAILNKFKTIDFSEEKAETHIIELPKFKIIDDEKLTKEEEWMSYFIGTDKKTVNRIKNQNIYIKELDKQVCSFWKNEKI